MLLTVSGFVLLSGGEGRIGVQHWVYSFSRFRVQGLGCSGRWEVASVASACATGERPFARSGGPTYWGRMLSLHEDCQLQTMLPMFVGHKPQTPKVQEVRPSSSRGSASGHWSRSRRINTINTT